MATTTLSPVKPNLDFIETIFHSRMRQELPRKMVFFVIFLAFIGMSFFAYQTAFVPHTRSESPNWYNAQWIHDPRTTSQVLYARKDFSLFASPGNAFLTIQGWQSYSVYVNGYRIDQTQNDVQQGLVNRAYIYDITSFLQGGANNVAIRAINNDTGSAAIRAVIGISYGNNLLTYPTNSLWKVTSNTQLANPNVYNSPDSWKANDFFDEKWNNGTTYTGPLPPSGTLDVLPALYEHPMATGWLTAGQTTSQAYFVSNVVLPTYTEVWLRLSSTGMASVALNGDTVITAPVRIVQGSDQYTPPGKPYLTTGLYDISKQMHSGQNTIDISVLNSLSLPTDRGTYTNAIPGFKADLVVVTDQGSAQFIGNATLNWRASTKPSNRWTTGQNITTAEGQWNPAISSTIPEISENQTKILWREGVQVDGTSAFIVFFLVALSFFGFFAIAGAVRYRNQQRDTLINGAIQDIAIACVPAIGLMVFFLALRIEPLVSRPFPFTVPIMAILILATVLTYAILIGTRLFKRDHRSMNEPFFHSVMRLPQRLNSQYSKMLEYVPIAILLIIGFFLATYQLGYESYWQDEVTSVYAALGILQNGIPHMLSGFVYPKAELFSYMLAGMIALFGQDPAHTRLLSVVEYCLSLGITFAIGKTWFNRWVGYIATGILLATPMTLQWARQARMYQQAELAVLISAYLFYRATRTTARPRDIYLAMGSIVLMYLSHEETFIILPAIMIYFVAVLRLRWARNDHWWIAGLLAMSVVFLQLFLVNATHPVILGLDHTQEPNIRFSPGNIDFYSKLFFSSGLLGHAYASLGFLMIMVIAGSILALFIQDTAVRYLVSLVWISLLTLNTIFALTADRYIYPLLPLMALIVAYLFFWIYQSLVTISSHLSSRWFSRSIGVLCTALLLLGMVVSELAPISNYSLAVSRIFGLPYQHIYPSYQNAGAYIRSHWQNGDIVVTISPAIDGAYYAHTPQYLIYTDKALYFSEQQNQPGELATGAVALLNPNDVVQLLSTYHRIWFLASNGYTCCTGLRTQPLLPFIKLVYEGGGTYVYLKG